MLTVLLDENQTLGRYEKLNLIAKWGCDGSSGHSEYKQTPDVSSQLSDDEDEEDDPLPPSDSHLFLFSLQPLALIGIEENSHKKINLWTNKKSSSTKYCRPIKFLYRKETADVIKHEVAKIQDEISQLEPYVVELGNQFVEVYFELLQTMVDGKVINALTGCSSQVSTFLFPDFFYT